MASTLDPLVKKDRQPFGSKKESRTACSLFHFKYTFYLPASFL